MLAVRLHNNQFLQSLVARNLCQRRNIPIFQGAICVAIFHKKALGIVAVCSLEHVGNDLIMLHNYISLHDPHEPFRKPPVRIMPSVYLLDKVTTARVELRLRALAQQSESE